MKKLSVSVSLALVLGLCVAPANATVKCGGDPVYDPGSNDQCHFTIPASMPGAEATVYGRFYGRAPMVREPSYLKDTADDGQDAYLWVRIDSRGQEYDRQIAVASGLGATVNAQALLGEGDVIYARVCVGAGTVNCSPWRR
ncbi:hypothetical protein [Lentzea kentuckyensis]|uniref:hypothetical protein n=1 Tax=Lentzea kentuckyensis TaxID=360086 RepID=UPI00117A0648|nr:hypothetical protein [Lentzea kentuckyensis]